MLPPVENMEPNITLNKKVYRVTAVANAIRNKNFEAITCCLLNPSITFCLNVLKLKSLQIIKTIRIPSNILNQLATHVTLFHTTGNLRTDDPSQYKGVLGSPS